jgi:leucine dehydrogenase
VNTTGEQLGTSTGIGIVNCIRACADHRGCDGLAGLRVAIQGCGLIGAGVARMLHAAGAELILADVSAPRAEALARSLGATSVPAEAIFAQDVDIVAPCAVGHVIDEQVAAGLSAWAICGGANNQLTDPPAVAAALHARGILYVPDFLASSGAVIDGVCLSLPGEEALEYRLERLYDTARSILQDADAAGESTLAVATRMARARIAAGRAAV